MPRLTVAGINRYRPSRKRREIRDSAVRGLYLVIHPTGAKSFVLRFCRPDGTPAKLTLGPLDLTGAEIADEPILGQPLTLGAAHALATRVHRLRALGRDVIGDYQALKQQHRVQAEHGAATAFPVIVRQFIREHAQPKTRRWRDTARLLGLYYPKDGSEPTVIKGSLCERWASKPITAIVGDDIHAVVDDTRRTGVPGLERRKSQGLADGQGRSMFAALSGVFSWCLKERRIATNPCTGIKAPSPPTQRDRVLDKAEIAAFWRATDKVGEPISQLLKLLLLTGARRDEVRLMRRSEITTDADGLVTWNIPGARAKNKLPHVVPLSAQALALLKSVKRVSGDYVFTLNGKLAIGFGSHRKAALDAAMQPTTPWVVHDLRRTAATGMAEIGIAPHIVEAVLNHVSGHKASVAGIYNKAEYASEKATALARWAVHVQGIASGKDTEAEKVVPLTAKRRGRK
jgi:integrase